MKSMTSYAYLDGIVNGTDISCELKSYNSRFLDLNINIPSTMSRLEPFLRKYFSKRIIRGKCDDKDFDEELWQKALIPLLNELTEKFNMCRIEEGMALATDIRKMLTVLSASVVKIERHAARMEELFSTMLKKKFSDLMEHEPDQQRVMQETAVLLVKYTINEEIIRAKAHIAALEKEITENETPGRRIDFLCQEINREINTIGSKNQLTEIGQAVISAKDALENIREQAHNIE